jgi:adenylate kinase
MKTVYYSTSVRGTNPNVSKQITRDQIEVLKKLSAKVYNDHLGSDDNNILDMGHSNDISIFMTDIEALMRSDVMIADITNPSHGVGKMISEAIHMNKQVLCLCHKSVSKISAMIAGDKRLVVKYYDDLLSYEQCVFNWLNPLKIILCGMPGSGKGTVAEKLSEEFDLVHISTGDLCREIARDTNHYLHNELKRCTESGELVSAQLMFDIVSNRLFQPDCKNKGFILDGYPPSKDDRDCIVKMNMRFNYLFYLQCSSETAIQRQLERGHEAGKNARPTDLNIEKIQKRVDTFCANMSPTIVMNEWFSNVPSMMVDAEANVNEVYSKISKVVQLNYVVPTQSSYFLEPFNEIDVNSTKFHFHIDAKNYWKLLEIVKLIHEQYQGAKNQIKIYPIEDLHLCSQVNEMEVYGDMLNFHEISESCSEAFVTGKIGDVFNADFMDTVIDICKKHECMTELEEYVFEGSLDQNGKRTEIHFESVDLNWTPKYLSLKNPRLELHHAFNIDKTKFPKMDLNMFANILKCNGFDIGGIFIFKNNEHWAYRTNQFSDDLSICDAILLLQSQATTLQAILLEYGKVTISYSLEIVHGIWSCDGIM